MSERFSTFFVTVAIYVEIGASLLASCSAMAAKADRPWMWTSGHNGHITLHRAQL